MANYLMGNGVALLNSDYFGIVEMNLRYLNFTNPRKNQ